MMRTLLQRTALVLGATLGMAAMPATARAQKALVYCPVSVDATGCNAIVNALTGPAYPLGVDRGYDGSGGTVDLKAVDLFTYSVFVVPSLADGAESQPYALLRDPEVTEHLKAALIGRIALWSGSPDQGATNRAMKDALIQNLAGWAGGAFGAAKGPGLVALLDASATAASRYDWVRAITPLPVASDPALLIYGGVRALNSRGTTILTSGMGPIAYDNMATFGFQVPNGAAGVSLDAVGQTGTSVGGQVVLLTMEAGNADGALVHTDTNDYPPGTTVVITGSGWAPGETITLTLHEDPLVDGDRVLTATADATGNFTNTEFAPEEHDLDVRFVLTAVGQSSGRRAQTTFTDGNPSTIALSPSSASVVAGSSAGYTVPLTMGGNTNVCTLTFSVTPLPTGVSASFTPTNPVTTNASFSTTLTLTTTNSGPVAGRTPPGTYPFTVTAVRGNNCQGTGNLTVGGTLVVTPATATTTTSISSSLNPSAFGQSVTFTATVGASSGTPTGTVTFKDGTSTIGIGTLATVGALQTATLTSSALTAGLHAITAEYAGAVGYDPSSSAALAQTVNKVAQVITFTSIEPSGAVVGGPTYAVSAMGGASGNAVTFSSAAPTVCTIVASTVSFVGAGSCVIHANQAGNTNYDAAAQVSQSFLVGKGAATIVLGGLSQTYDRTVKAATATTTPSGLSVSITYAQGGNSVPSPTNAGSYDVIATITDPNFDGSTAGTLTIAAKEITGSFTAENKIYDGTMSASISGRTLAGVIAPDVVTLEGGTATFDSKNVGTGKIVTGVGFTLGGSSAANYTLASSTLTCTADVTARSLTVTAAGVNKSYDGNATATVTLGDNRVSGDVLSLAYAAASFADKNVGTSKSVSVTGISVTGADAGNYTFNTTASATADINARALTVSAAGQNKVYDATATATVTLSDDRVVGDALSTAYTSASFADKNVGTNKTVTVSGISVTGVDAGNYTFNATATTSANITARPVAITATGVDKTYDGTTAATVTLSDDRIAGDMFTASSTNATFGDKNVGTAKPISVSGISISGTDATNYALGSTTLTTTAEITARALVVSATGVDKVYDGNTSATVNLSDDRVSGDAITTSYASASFADKTVGTAKPVSVSGIAITGADAPNYTFNTTAATQATVTAKQLTVSVAGVNKVYDGNTTATVTSVDDRVAGDVLTNAYGAANFDNANVGNAKPISVTGITITGPDAANYTFNTTASTSADVTPRQITVTAAAQTKVYGDDDPALTYSITAGALVNPGDVSGALSRVIGQSVASYAIQQGTVALTSNYQLTYVGANFTITPRALTVTANDKSKIAGAPNPLLDGMITGIQYGDDITANYSTTAVTGSLPATYPITPALVDLTNKLGNYSVTVNNGTLTVTPNAIPLVGAIIAPLVPTPVGTEITVSAPFSDDDPAASQPYTTIIDWGNGTNTTVTNVTAPPGPITGTKTYTVPGVYTIKVTVTQNNFPLTHTNTKTLDYYVVVYDPSAGFVTGGGWIVSPTGAYAANPSLSGNATFGFVSKYKKGQNALEGSTEFQFHAAGMNFKSTAYEWLVVAGNKAQFKGTGTIDGAGNYGFMLTAIDGQISGGGGTDKFRIKIWNIGTGATVYDNQMSLPDDATPTTLLGGGSINIQAK